MERGRTKLEAPAGSGVVVPPTSVGARLGELAEADLLALRLAAQVLGHKAGLLGRPTVVDWFAALEHAVDFEMARRGVGFVLGPAPELRLPAHADGADRRLLADHLGLLADNDRLAPQVRALCAELQATINE